MASENPFEGLSEENAIRMYVYLTTIKRSHTSVELYKQYGYVAPMSCGVINTLEIACDIQKNGVIKSDGRANTGCFGAIIFLVSAMGLLIAAING